jgi:hypothetical protein
MDIVNRISLELNKKMSDYERIWERETGSYTLSFQLGVIPSRSDIKVEVIPHFVQGARIKRHTIMSSGEDSVLRKITAWVYKIPRLELLVETLLDFRGLRLYAEKAINAF